MIEGMKGRKPILMVAKLLLAIFFILVLFVGFTTIYVPGEYPVEGKPAHHTNRGFRNLYIEDPQKSFFSFLQMRLFGDVEWADHEATGHLVPFQKLDLTKVNNPPIDKMQVSWLGHSTFLIQYMGVNILTDPILGDYASPFPGMGPKRYVPHVMDYEDLPRVDFVVISHNHYDHLDVEGIRRLGSEPIYLVPLGIKKWLTDEGVDASRVQELDWWQMADPALTGKMLHIEAQPSQHWSARGLFDRRKTLWASWYMNIAGKTIWFAGDTGYNSVGFKEIGEKNGPVDLALIPIGAYDPRFFMKTYHVDPDEAVMIHRDVKARQSIGMHWGTFPLTAEVPMDPPARLKAAKKREELADEVFRVLAIGETSVLN